MLAVGKPSSRPRRSPSTTVPSTMKGAPRQRRRALHLAGGDQRADPGRGDGLAVDLDQRHDAGLELLARGEHLRVPFALAPKRKFSPTETLLAPSRSTRTPR